MKQVSSSVSYTPAFNSLKNFLKSKEVPKIIPIKVESENLYKEFTNTFILKAMSTTYRDRIQQIKGKYK